MLAVNFVIVPSDHKKKRPARWGAGRWKSRVFDRGDQSSKNQMKRVFSGLSSPSGRSWVLNGMKQMTQLL